MTFGARGSSSSALSTVPLTSVEAERIFSICGQFYASIRSSLSAETIDMLVFTKYFILRHKYNSIFTYLEYVFTQNYQLYIIYAITMFNEHICLN